MFILVQSTDSINALRHYLGLMTSIPLSNQSTIIIESVIGICGGEQLFLFKLFRDSNSYALKVIDKFHTSKSGKEFRHFTSENC